MWPFLHCRVDGADSRNEKLKREAQIKKIQLVKMRRVFSFTARFPRCTMMPSFAARSFQHYYRETGRQVLACQAVACSTQDNRLSGLLLFGITLTRVSQHVWAYKWNRFCFRWTFLFALCSRSVRCVCAFFLTQFQRKTTSRMLKSSNEFKKLNQRLFI